MVDGVVPQTIARLPWRLLLLVVAVGMFGGVTLFSAAGGSITPWALNHFVRFFALLGMAVLISYVRIDTFKRAAFPAYGIIMLLLVVVQTIGAVRGGAQSWLELGPLRLQPSELMKPVLVLVLASFYAALPAGEIRRFSAIWPAAALTMVPGVLILIQPDLGTALLLIFSAIVVMFLAGLPLRLFLGGMAAVAALVPLAYSFLLPHQQKRLLIFLNPEDDPLGAGYHITQSKIAIGSGGLFGKGFLNGTQSHLNYLPEQHTDFIFPAMAEEWGLAGGLFLIACFTLIFRWGMRVALDAKGRFSRLTAAGLTLTIFFYFAINLLMVMGLAPVVGIPLPLFSYGGSAMLTVMICLGIMMAIDRDNRANRR
ncbi:rod shape-determining protein RodA [Allosphingosinicella indica]|uniref:Peptidoglycan glycosyltransferase MrdB n=1 Tax=Allosphingosinicella indica TaxID=941907 RepID=A0A1X7H203_9SPHN|nr:rod shape-determining protein RodA [Allosphingosinicella indica]SMF78441.1 cell elongation-specific peptidoglycan biosynthesis regulator RodA [Allosphingosinicella indica]